MQLEEMLRELCDLSASLYARGYAFGSTGNLSLRCGDEVWITPTGVSLRNLTPGMLARIDRNGRRLNANLPSKEYPFHLAAYTAAGARAGAIVHLHSTNAVALSCLDDFHPHEDLPVFTPYFLMRVAPLGVVDYFRPGSEQLADAIGRACSTHNCLLLRNHGLICLGRSLNEAVDRAEELEQAAKLYFQLHGRKSRLLSPAEQEEIARVFLRGA